MSEQTFIPPDYGLLIARLRDAQAALGVPLHAEPGSLVRWRRGFQQSGLMEANGIAVVVAWFDPPTVARDVDPQNDGYGLPLDIEVGTLDVEGRFFLFRTWSRFLEPAADTDGCVAALLRATYAAFATPHRLQAGDLVAWKPQCVTPGPEQTGRPAVILELLDGERIVRPGASLDADFGRPVDAAVAIEDERCPFRVVWTDRRCLAPYVGEVREPAAAEDATAEEREAAAKAPSAVAARLQDRYARLHRPTTLEVGSLVRWKPGLRNRLVPLEGDAAVVVGLPAEPPSDPLAAAGSELWREPLTVVLGCMGEDGHFVVCHYDARRFEPLTDEASEHKAFLERSYAAYRTQHRFRAGQLVEWKPGLVNRNSPADGDLAIVVESLAAPRISEHIEGSSPYFQEPLSLVVGVRDDDAFLLLHVDGGRFQPARSAGRAEEAAWLRDCHGRLRGPAHFAPGSVVAWKEGLCAYPKLESSRHGVVACVYDPPLTATTHSAGSLAFGVPNTLSVGFLDDDGQLRFFPVDGRRVEPAVGEDEQDRALLELYRAYAEPHAFALSDVVVWRAGLKGEGFLDLTPESPGIILRHLDPPFVSPQKDILAGDYGIRADVLVGGFDVDGDFAVVHAESRRLAAHPAPHGDAARRVRGFRRRMRRSAALSPGMLVAWKDRFCAHTALPTGIPGIVLETHEKPVVALNASVTIDSPAFAVPWDTVVGVWSDARLVRVHCDSRRLEPFDPVVHGEILQRRTIEEARQMDDFSRLLEEFDEDDPPF